MIIMSGFCWLELQFYLYLGRGGRVVDVGGNDGKYTMERKRQAQDKKANQRHREILMLSYLILQDLLCSGASGGSNWQLADTRLRNVA